MSPQFKSIVMERPKLTTLVALLMMVLSGLLALPMRSQADGTLVYVDASASGTGDGQSPCRKPH